MDQFRILGGGRLTGRIKVGGAKNSALPCLAASLLTADTVTLHNVPHVRDLITMRWLLQDLGAQVLVPALHTLRINSSTVETFEARYELVKTMRASVLVLGPLIARFGQARVSLPGGCAIGQRPIDLHLSALEKMGASIQLRGGAVEATASRLRGAEISFEMVSVTGTENVLMAATLASGTTRIINAACEPEVVDLAQLLIKMGAKIEGAGSSVITIQGVADLSGAEHQIIADRIEAGTFAVAAAITMGDLSIDDCNPSHLQAVIEKLRLAGVEIDTEGDTGLHVACRRQLQATSMTTEVYPGFPTDMQAQYMTLMTQAHGESEIDETIFENRYMHVGELLRLGAQIEVNGHQAAVDGPTPLTGARIMASDLRASASLVLAGLVAEGETWVERVYHIDRGYEQIEKKLISVGAKIERVKSGSSMEVDQRS